MIVAGDILLSKSKFVAGLQCLKRLYLQTYQPELAEETDEGQEALLEQGREVGLLAQQRFPNGATVAAESYTPDAALSETARLMRDPSVHAIYEGAFLSRGILVRADILQLRPRNRWRLIEVKSAVDLKDHYVYDLAIQYYVLSHCGMDISSACLMHLNRDYRFDGVRHDPARLFVIRNLTRQVKSLQNEIRRDLRVQRKVLQMTSPPETEPGAQCSSPVECEFFSRCNPALPEHHISFLPRLSLKKAQALEALDVSLIRDIPDDFPLTEQQTRVWQAVRTGQPWISAQLPGELSKLRFPRAFMDFESFYPAIPRYSGMWPYSHIPFQWSVDRQDQYGSEPEHFEYLANDQRDPRREFVESLLQTVGKRATIVVYNASFEAQRLRELADWLPAYRERIEQVAGRLWDLYPFVRRHIYHPRFSGSFSIKAVLPALAPGLTYEGMDVSDGAAAGLVWDTMINGDLKGRERERLREALLAYCRQDTLAMVRVLEALARFTQSRKAAG